MDYFVVFGAGVLPGGVPSGTLRRRVAGAFALGGVRTGTRYLVTGAIGRHGPSEARVMRGLLVEYGVPVEHVVLEEASADTLSSARHCARILRECGDAGRVVVCTSRYHVPRCRLLLRMLGVAALAGDMPPERPAIGTRRWLYYAVRESAALPWDGLLVLALRALGRAP